MLLMGVSAVLILIPRMVTVMMEGLTALGNAASAYMKSKMGDDAEIYIGMDIALGLGDPCCITSTVIAIPCVILMAFIIPLICTPVVFIINVASGAKKFVKNVTKNKHKIVVTILRNKFPLLAITHIGVTNIQLLIIRLGNMSCLE